MNHLLTTGPLAIGLAHFLTVGAILFIGVPLGARTLSDISLSIFVGTIVAACARVERALEILGDEVPAHLQQALRQRAGGELRQRSSPLGRAQGGPASGRDGSLARRPKEQAGGQAEAVGAEQQEGLAEAGEGASRRGARCRMCGTS